MPAKQRGQVLRRGDGWACRYYDDEGRRKRQGGFRTKSEAADWLDDRLANVEALKRGEATRPREIPTLCDLVDSYLEQHVADQNTIDTLRARLKRATAAFGDTRIDRLAVSELRRWRGTLPGSAWHYVKALRQVLNYAVSVGMIATNPAREIPNPEPKRREIAAFGSWGEVEAVAEELGPSHRAIPLFCAATGLRPEEWIALERADVDRGAGIVHVRRVYTDGRVKPYGKQPGSLRAVPLPRPALEALDAMPARIDTRLVFPGARGGHLNLHAWRAKVWRPALRAAGLEYRPPYALRHSYASFAIAAGMPLFDLARFMGTSVEQIDRTYGHLLPDSLERGRTALESFLVATADEAGADRLGP
jgi:integrase